MKSIMDILDEVEQTADENRQEGLVYCAGDWYRKLPSGLWVAVTQQMATQFLKRDGFGKGDASDEKSASYQLTRIIEEKSVVYAGRLAGWPAGIHESNGKLFLVTETKPVPEARQGQCPNLQAIMEGLLGGFQWSLFKCWLRRRRESLIHQQHKKGQAVVLFGKIGCGKSFTQALVSAAIGGSTTKPWRYMAGKTEFNADLAAAEHLMIEDEAPYNDIQSRRSVGSKIKSMLYGDIQSIHGKGLNAVPLEPRWTLTISLNDEPENMRVLPPLDDSVSDKIMIFKCTQHGVNAPNGRQQREWQEELLRTELPALLWEIDHAEIPDGWHDPRSGVLAYQHPDALEMLQSSSPEQALLELIVAHIDQPTWEGSAADLERQLRGKDQRAMDHLAKWSNAVATYLGRIMRLKPDAVESFHTKAGNRWRINVAML